MLTHACMHRRPLYHRLFASRMYAVSLPAGEEKVLCASPTDIQERAVWFKTVALLINTTHLECGIRLHCPWRLSEL